MNQMKKEYLMIGGAALMAIVLLILGIAFSTNKEEELAMFGNAVMYELGGEYSDETKTAIIDALNGAIIQIGDLEELPSADEIREILLATLKEKVPELEEACYEQIVDLVMPYIVEEYFAEYIKVNEDITNLETKITTIQSEITENVGSNMTTVEVTMKDMQLSITEIKETIATIKESDEMNNQEVSEKIEEIDAVIVIIEDQISELYGKSSSLSEKINSMSEELKDDLAKEMKAVEVEITKILTEIEAIQISIEQIVSDIEALVLEDEVLQSQIDLALEKIVKSNLDISELSVSLTDLTGIVSSNNESLLTQLDELEALSESKLNEVRERLDSDVAGLNEKTDQQQEELDHLDFGVESLQKSLEVTNASVSENDMDIEDLYNRVEGNGCLIEINRVGIEGNGVEIANTNTKLDEFKSTLDSCFQSVSSGKGVVASAITDKGVSTDANVGFSDMAANILMINAGDAPSENPSYTVEEYRHTHEGSSDVCGGCYTEPVYHVHVGNPYENGGCYTIATRCGGQITKREITSHQQPDGWSCNSPSGHCAWICGICGKHEVYCKGHYTYSCSKCGNPSGSSTCNTITSYGLSCGQSTDTIVGYEVGCGLREDELTGYDVRFN